jgi:hypothetical protein
MAKHYYQSRCATLYKNYKYKEKSAKWRRCKRSNCTYTKKMERNEDNTRCKAMKMVRDEKNCTIKRKYRVGDQAKLLCMDMNKLYLN